MLILSWKSVDLGLRIRGLRCLHQCNTVIYYELYSVVTCQNRGKDTIVVDDEWPSAVSGVWPFCSHPINAMPLEMLQVMHTYFVPFRLLYTLL